MASAAVILWLASWSQVHGEDVSSVMQNSRALAAERHQAGVDVSDPAFDVYVLPEAIGEAYASSDAEQLSDVAFQLAEGERVLLRNRRGITADQAFKLAVQAAGNRGDKPALDRLSKAAKQRDDQELATHIAAAQTLAATSHDTTPRLMFPIDKVDAAETARIRYCLRAISQARLTGDSRRLTALEQDIETCLCEPYRAGIKRMIAEARATNSVSSESDEQLISNLETFQAISASRDALSRLAMPSRQGPGTWWWLVEWWNPSRGAWFIDTKVRLTIHNSPRDVGEANRARNRERQLQGCGYETRITTVYSELIPDRRWMRANCPPKPVGAIGTTNDSANIGKTTKPPSSASVGNARRGAHIDDAGKVFYNGKYIGKATKTTYQGRACWMFDGGLAAIYRFVNESKTHEKNLLTLP